MTARTVLIMELITPKVICDPNRNRVHYGKNGNASLLLQGLACPEDEIIKKTRTLN